MTRFTESVVEDAEIDLLGVLGYIVIRGGDMQS